MLKFTQAARQIGKRLDKEKIFGKMIKLAQSLPSHIAEYRNDIDEERQVSTSSLVMQNPPYKPFGLANTAQAARYWRSLYDKGTTLKCNYRVFLQPFSSGTAVLPIFNKQYVGNPLLGFLATEVELPLL